MKTFFKIIIAAQFFLMINWAFAQIPDTQYSKGLAYITGGVGEGESVAILAEAKQWPLLLEMSQIENGRGVWIFGANIKVFNSAKSTIFDAQAEGPYMLINLVPGDYVIEGTYEGVVQRRQITMRADSPQKVAIFWK